MLDEVVFDADAFPFLRGASISLGTLDDTANDEGIYWCLADYPYGYGDFGTPGYTNAYCNLYGYINRYIFGRYCCFEIMHSPSMVYDYKGEWFELHNTLSENINIKGLRVTADDGDVFTIDDDVVVES